MAQSHSMPFLAALLLASAGAALPSTGHAQQPVDPGPRGSVTLAPDAAQSKADTAKSGTADIGKSDSGKTDSGKGDSGKGDSGTSDQAKSDAGAGKQDGGKRADNATRSPQDQRQADREAFFAARLAALHAGLTLSDDQESLWPPVETAIRELAKTRGGRIDREQVARLLQETPSDLVRMRSEQLIRRGQAMRKLVEATGPLLDRLSDAQKNRLPVLLEGLRPSIILRAAFDIRYGRVVDDPDEDGAKGRQGQRGDHEGMAHRRDGMMQDRGRDGDDHGYREGGDDPMPRRRSSQDDDDRS